ncbi:N-acyl homoserine lactonase family protein [Actinomadura nitritigenes]|uniref:N-acyl homoserine lactonase family protein n=1 Tax=Actinomadura nitritigenes TaxID=134602 RepID=UPI003D90F02B
MNIHPLRIGRTKVPFGQFYGGLEGFSISEFAADKDHFIWVPIHAYLLEHPTAGPILVDTGINPEQAAHTDYYRGSIMEHVMDADEYDLPDEETMPAQLARLGYRPEDIRAVFITHFHEDHVGALNLFAHAPVYLGAAEYAAREDKVLGLVPLAYPPSIAAITDWRPLEFTGPALGGFTGSADVFGDGSVIALPTPGHSPGSTSVLVDHRFLLTGDAMYTIRHLAVDQVRAIQTGGETRYVDSIRRIQWLRRELPELLVLTSHDHTEYGERLIAGLATGRLSDADLAWAKAYERAAFDELANINPARLPRFVPAADGGPVGHAD